ncbi:MAG: hypothetical protein ACRD0Y_09875 [Terriglobales bacterium]
MNLDEELKSALQRQEPREDLAPKVLARLRLPQRGRDWGLRAGRLRLAIALVVIVAGLGVLQWREHTQQQQRGRAAAQQLVAALHLASNELNSVRAQVVRTP